MRKKRTQILAVALAVLMMVVTVVSAAAIDDPTVGRYTISIPDGKKLICRAAPSSESEQIDFLAGGEIVEVVAVSGQWAKTRQNGRDCWFAAKYGELTKKYDMAALIADVSSATAEEVDFAKLAGAGVKGVILRFGVSLNSAEVITADINIAKNYEAAQKAGLKIGLNFTSSAENTAQIARETSWVLANLASLALKPSLPVFYSPLLTGKTSFSQDVNTQNAIAFCKALEDAGIQAGVFLPADWTTQNLSFANLGDYAHWIADYADYCNFSSTYDIWQYAQNESFDGVKGTIGLSYMFTDVTVPTKDAPPTSEPTSEPSSTPTSEPSSTPVSEPTSVQPSGTEVAPTAPGPANHKEGAFAVVKEPGCETWGLEAAKCTDCGKLVHTRVVAPVGHQAGPWVVVAKPTATADGLAVKYCTVCGKLMKEQIVLFEGTGHIHSLGGWTVAKEQGVLAADNAKYPNATAPGAADPAEAADAPIDASLIGKYPCTTCIEVVQVCGDCGKIVERAYGLPATHIPGEQKAVSVADCEKDGYDATVCAVCGAVIEERITPAYGHAVANWTIVRQSTSSTDGERSGVCSRCGKTVTETIPAYAGILGDVNGDANVNSIDARLVLQVAARTLSFTDAQFLLGDVDRNGKITSADARLVLRAAAKLDTLA